MELHVKNLLHSSTLHIAQINQIHGLLITNFPSLMPLFTRKLLNLSFLQYAHQVLDEIPHPDHTLYNHFISAYSRLSLNREAIHHFSSMRQKGIWTDCYAFASVLKSCSSISSDTGFEKQVHSLVVKHGLESSVFVQTSLLGFYSKFGDLNSAKLVFDGVLVKDPMMYNTLISGYSRHGNISMARELFDEMPERTLVSWNAILSCYANNGAYQDGFRILDQMKSEKFQPNEWTVAIALSMCAKLGDFEMGMSLKQIIDDNGWHNNMVVSTALLEMYVKCGAVEDARKVFDKMLKRDTVAWTSMISGYAQNGRSSEALELFEKMEDKVIKPNNITLVSVLSACSQLGSAETGNRIGGYIEKRGFDSDKYVASALLAMYSKCGNIEKAREVFNKMPQKDTVAWNSIITGLAINGLAEDAFLMFAKMVETGTQPDSITYVGLLTACAHAGLVQLGFEFFKSMREEHGIKPEIEHYSCIVDLLCRSGRVEEAYKFICEMEFEPNGVVWGTLLSASRIQSNLELAEISLNKLIEQEPDNSGNYVLLSNVYASVDKWQEVCKFRNLMKTQNLQKTAACSWIELGNKVNKFLVRDTSHPLSNDIYRAVHNLSTHLTRFSYDFAIELEMN
ncbi:pentatricopeptide repeat-containing protein At1g08070, chloroplastic-like [Impatiens glandulifera]|uniref:pentatricopeptide repeat-containing protein At1g08070, chloroplastic-like n=1 Tax=Impatiens glandulifera TaxID=253017 RepID=UPI001FB179B2|nr:pentatricopeptide repeat-containing protein At1g08070, chloroplastic-like [Impatiens glandulifera]